MAKRHFHSRFRGLQRYLESPFGRDEAIHVVKYYVFVKLMIHKETPCFQVVTKTVLYATRQYFHKAQKELRSIGV